MQSSGPHASLRIHKDRRATLRELHRKGARSFWQTMSVIVLFFVFAGVSLACWHSPYWPLVVLSWAVQSFCGHVNLLAFHETSHFLLHPKRRWNEAAGIFIGTIALIPLSAYRYIHNMHHLYLGTERDVELWPFVYPRVSRGFRLLAAACELGLGLFHTPLVFLHGLWVCPPKATSIARRIKLEYVLCVTYWCASLALISYFGLWEVFLVGYFIPALIAGNLQSLRKFIEHMGMLGDDVPGLTRTIVAPDLLGRLLSHTMLHIEVHGIHHRYAKIPHFRLKEAVPHVYDAHEQETAIKPSYWSALLEMLPTLRDPRIGKQWLQAAAEPVLRKAA